MIEALLQRAPFLLHALLLAVGIYVLLTHRNLLKAMIGVSLVQSSIILFYISLGVRDGATIPILEGQRPLHNPLPHALMLTAIVVGVATLGVALAILRRLHEETGSIQDLPREDSR